MFFVLCHNPIKQYAQTLNGDDDHHTRSSHRYVRYHKFSFSYNEPIAANSTILAEVVYELLSLVW